MTKIGPKTRYYGILMRIRTKSRVYSIKMKLGQKLECVVLG